VQLPYLSYIEGTARKGLAMTEFTSVTPSTKNSTVAIVQYIDVSDIVFNLDRPQKGSGILVLGSNCLTYSESKYNEDCFGSILSSTRWC
jgi:hypothetical protein